MILTFTK